VYLEHFSLRELPFTLSPNTEFYFDLEGHRQAMAVVQAALHKGDGYIRICGEAGRGKTLLCRRLLQNPGDEYLPAYIPNPFLSPDGLILAIARELGTMATADMSRPQLLVLLDERFKEMRDAGKKVLLLLDDVQAMPEETIEALLGLPGQDCPGFLQILFAGQPELNDLLHKDRLASLKSRITKSYTLPLLNREETASYIHHRLRCGGFPGRNLFTPQAVDEIHQNSRGNPRIINILSHKALLAAYGKRETNVNFLHVIRGIEETEEAWLQSHLKPAEKIVCDWRTMLLACFGASAMTFTLVWALMLQ